VSDKPDLALEADDLSADPLVQFRRWFEDAEAEGIHLANAIALGTADVAGRPAVRQAVSGSKTWPVHIRAPVRPHEEAKCSHDPALGPRA